MNPASEIASRLDRVKNRIAAACAEAGRDAGSVELVAVSKGHPADAVEAAHRAGHFVFGESYAQEFKQKLDSLSHLADLKWHFIGRVQEANSAAISLAHLVHGVGSLHQAMALAKAGIRTGRPVSVLLQVNIENEPTKNGFSSEGLQQNLPSLRALRGLELCGLMSMPRSPDVRRAFAEVRRLRDRACPELPWLSMGMSDDFEAAILEGATHVRVGTAIFGPRAQGAG